MPTGDHVAGEHDSVVPDEPIPEVEAELDAAVDRNAEFLHAVRAMVHGEPATGASDGEPVPDPAGVVDEVVAEDALGDWLPGVWEVVERPTRGGARRVDRRAVRQARKQDEKTRKREAKLARRSLDVAAEQVRSDQAVVGRIPAQADPSRAEAVDVGLGSAAAAVGPSRRDRRRRRRQETARAIAAAVPTDDELEDEPVGAAQAATITARRVRRRDRRRARAAAEPVLRTELVVSDAADIEPAPEVGPVVTGPRDDGSGRRREPRSERAFARTISKAAAKGESRSGPLERETLAEHVARVDAPVLPRRSRRSRPRLPRKVRRAATLAVVVVLVGACVAVPWLAPSVPQAISDLLPGGSKPVKVEDPKVAPPTDAFVGPVGVVRQAGPLAGERLEAAGQPREVLVPRLDVDSEVVPISGQSGSLLPPSDPQVLGWWREGRQVGAQAGTAVVTGHTVHTGGGALDQLDQLVVGDRIRVRTDNGWIRYVVQRTRVYSTDELARDAEKVFRLDGPGRLVMITCDDWNGSFYESNAVVVATPVQDLPTVS